MRRWIIALLAVAFIVLVALIALVVYEGARDPGGVAQSSEAPPSPTATPSSGGLGGLGGKVSGAAPRPAPEPPAPIAAPAPPSPRTRLDELVSQFKTAHGAMAAPEQATEGTEEKVSLVLSPSGTSAEAVGLATEAAPRSVATPLQAKYHELMEAKLTGDGFRIVARTPERQAVPTVEPTRWEWSVVPITAGSLPLHIALSAVVEAGGDHAPRLVTTFERTVQVAVRPIPFSERVETFAQQHWQWLLGAIGTLLGATWRAGVWWKRRRHKQNAAPSAATGKFE